MRGPRASPALRRLRAHGAQGRASATDRATPRRRARGAIAVRDDAGSAAGPRRLSLS